MAIEELLQVVSPPTSPAEAGDAARRAEVERELGTRLPQDLFDYAARYGTGQFHGPFNLTVLNPFSVTARGFLATWSDLLRIPRGLPRDQAVPGGMFPSRPGWLPWGLTDVGQTFCYVTEGEEPEDWPLLLVSDQCKSFQQLRLPMTSFLAQFFSRRTRPFFAIRERISVPRAVTFTPMIFPTTPPQAAPPATSTPAVAPVAVPWEGEWFPADELGRPTGARVSMGPGNYWDFWNGFSAEGFTVCPAWWAGLPDLHRWRRGQLIGWRLGGPGGAALHNLIPLNRRAQRELWVVEAAAATRVFSGSQLTYVVHLAYQGANRYPSRLTLQSSFLPGRPDSGPLSAWTIDNT